MLLLIPAISIFAMGAALVRPLLMGKVSRSVSKDNQGVVMGVADSLRSISQIVGPLIGGFVLTRFFPESLMIVSALVMLVAFPLILKEGKEYD